MMNSKTRARLRAMANTVEAILQVGKNGMGDALQKQVDDALTARELIKLTVLETAPETPKEMAALLAEANKWELRHGGVSGRTAQQFINYLAGTQTETDE